MYRLLKEHLNDRFVAICAQAFPDYRPLASAAKGGGKTLRFVPKKGVALFIGLEPIAQRERAQLFFAWSKLGRVPKFDDVHWTCLDALRRNTSPKELVLTMEEGCLYASDLGIQMGVLDVEPDWVPWQTIRARLVVDERFRLQLAGLKGDELVALLLDPSRAHESPRPFSLSWEQWFLMIDKNIDGGPDVGEIMAGTVNAMEVQLTEVFKPFMASCTLE